MHIKYTLYLNILMYIKYGIFKKKHTKNIKQDYGIAWLTKCCDKRLTGT